MATTKTWTTQYPANLDTTVQQPTVSNDDDLIDASHVNALSLAVRELEEVVGSNNYEAGSLREIVDGLPSTFSGLTDTPSTMIGHAGELLIVGDNEVDIDFATLSVLEDGVEQVASFSGLNFIGASIVDNGGVANITITPVVDTALPRLTWVNSAQYSVAAWPSKPSQVRVTLQDSVQRSFTGTLTWSPTFVGDGGLDTGTESNGIFYYLYLVPKTGFDNELVVVGSLDDPDTGPTGYSNWCYIGAVYNGTGGDLRQLMHVRKDQFAWIDSVEEVTGASWDTGPTQRTLYVPNTASAVDILVRLQANGSAWGNYRIWADTGSVPSDSTSNTVMWCGLSSSASDHCHARGWVPLATPRSLYYRRYQGSGSLLSSEMTNCGWIDAYLTA